MDTVVRRTSPREAGIHGGDSLDGSHRLALGSQRSEHRP